MCRAKTIKNSVVVNEELTAEEWKRRFEKERDKNARLKGIIERYEAELAKWRAGQSIQLPNSIYLSVNCGCCNTISTSRSFAVEQT